MGHAQVIGFVLCHFPKCSIICPVGPVDYCPGHASNTISLGTLPFYVGFQKVAYEPLEHCYFDYPQVSLVDHPTMIKKCRLSSNINYQSQPSKKQ